jgi:hypothetical protein
MSEGNGASNGKGTGEGKSLADLAVQRRQEVRRRKDLSNAGKLLFDDLTDLCFLSRRAAGFGVVRIGKPELSERLGCSVPTITRAQKELTPDELWSRTIWYEGHEMTLWFLRGVAEGQLEFDAFTQGATRASRTRVAPRIPAERNGHGHFCKPGDRANSLQNGGATAELTVHPGQSCRLAPVNPAVATPSELTVGNGQNQPSGPVRTDRGERSELTVVDGQNHRADPLRADGGTTAELTVYKDRDRRNGDKAGAPPSKWQWETE